MSEQQMPARIWAEDDYTEHSAKYWSLEPYSSTVSYIRADIAERMAEALEKLKNEAVGMIAFGEVAIRQAVGNTNVNCLQHRINNAEEALSAFRSATQDTGARHD